jgi:hypothetical protein
VGRSFLNGHVWRHEEKRKTFDLHLQAFVLGKKVRECLERRVGLKNPPKTVEEYLESLERQGLAQTVSVLRQFAELI